MSNLPNINLPIRERDGEPRVLDTDLGAFLQMAQPLNIRRQIEKHRETLEQFGEVFTQRVKTSERGGRPSVAYSLNEHQAVFLTTQSDTSVARQKTVEIVKVFVAWRHGHIAPVAPSASHIARIVAAVTERQVRGVSGEVHGLAEQVDALRSFVTDLAVTVDRTRSATDFIRALDVAVQEKVPPKGRGGLVRSISARLRTYSATVGYPMRRSAETGTWLFHVDAVNAWMRAEGSGLIRSHMDRLAGQGVIRFPSYKRAA